LIYFTAEVQRRGGVFVGRWEIAAAPARWGLGDGYAVEDGRWGVRQFKFKFKLKFK
jgi:hypothetical protein